MDKRIATVPTTDLGEYENNNGIIVKYKGADLVHTIRTNTRPWTAKPDGTPDPTAQSIRWILWNQKTWVTKDGIEVRGFPVQIIDGETYYMCPYMVAERSIPCRKA